MTNNVIVKCKYCGNCIREYYNAKDEEGGEMKIQKSFVGDFVGEGTRQKLQKEIEHLVYLESIVKTERERIEKTYKIVFADSITKEETNNPTREIATLQKCLYGDTYTCEECHKPIGKGNKEITLLPIDIRNPFKTICEKCYENILKKGEK